MSRIATIMREDSSYPNGRPHDVYMKKWRLCGLMFAGMWHEAVPSTVTSYGIVEADSAFAARAILAQLSGRDPMSLRVEEVP